MCGVCVVVAVNVTDIVMPTELELDGELAKLGL